MEKILHQTAQPYYTTPYLLSLYSGYLSPRDKISTILKNGDLVHVKQGLYVLGDSYNKYYSREVLSGMIYGPSAISLEYALSYHGLIPERVEELTCICFKKEKRFNTPVGRFSYKYISSEKYTCGIRYHKTDLGNFFMATPEKALCDKVYFSVLNKEQDMSSYLLDELRIDRDQLRKLDLIELARLASIYKRKTCHYLVETISRLQNEED